MQVTQILSNKGKEVFSISPDATVNELVRRLHSHRVGALLVQDETGQVVGIVSERDVVRGMATQAGIFDAHVTDIMTADVVSITPSTDVAELTRLMTQHRIRHVPVIDDKGRVVGLISIGDVVKIRMDELESERAALVDYITHGG